MSKWEGRCYSGGIPDEAPRKLEKSGLVPSYRQIALALLNNDMRLHSLGFHDGHSEFAERLYWARRREREAATATA